MSMHGWMSLRLARGGAALGIGFAMLAATGIAAAYASDPVVNAGRAVRTAEVLDENMVEPGADPTDGSIIIECVALQNRVSPNIGTTSKWVRIAMPQYPLGPSKCWPREQKRT